MADIIAHLQKNGIYKKVLHGGSGEFKKYKDGTKVYFHYKTTKCDEGRTVLDDSRNHTKPMELIFGKKFKLEIWELCLHTMKSHEVAEFMVDKKHLDQYPAVAKSLRGIFLKNDKHHHHEEKHCCGMMSLAEQGLGYPDLDELIKEPQPLIFTLEILKIEEPGSYEKEAWTMTDEEKTSAVPRLKEEGNDLYGQKKYKEAEEKYAQAIGMLEQLVLKEKPGDPLWHELEDKKTPLLLNYCQCKLLLEDYYAVIEHASTVLKREPDNVKALYRRAKAHVGAWNPEDAKNDFARVVELDPKLSSAVKKELKLLEEKQRQRDAEDKEKMQAMFR